MKTNQIIFNCFSTGYQIFTDIDTQYTLELAVSNIDDQLIDAIIIESHAVDNGISLW